MNADKTVVQTLEIMYKKMQTELDQINTKYYKLAAIVDPTEKANG